MDNPKSNTLQQIVDAIGAVQQSLQDTSLSREQRTAIESTEVMLRDIQNAILIASEQALVDALSGQDTALSQLADEINKASAKLDQLANTIKKVANVVGTLVTITAAAVSAGL